MWAEIVGFSFPLEQNISEEEFSKILLMEEYVNFVVFKIMSNKKEPQIHTNTNQGTLHNRN